MATRLEKSGGLTFTRGGRKGLEMEKSKDYQEFGLCLALIVLVVLALFVSFH